LSRKQRCQRCLLVAVTALAMGCSGSSSDENFSGVAYPKRGPTFEAAGRRLGYVANRNSDTVSVLDLDAMALLGSVPVGRGPVDIDGPRHVVIDAENGLGYVALSYPFSIPSPHQLTQGGVTQRSGYVEALNLLDLSEAGEVRVDPNATDVAFSPATGRLAVTHMDLLLALAADPDARRANLVLVDPARSIASSSATANRVKLCSAPAAVAFDGDGARVFVACTGEDTVSVVDSQSGEVLSSVPAGDSLVNKPYALVTDPARERLLVGNQVSYAVSIFDMNDSPNLLNTLHVLGVPMFPALISEGVVAVPFQNPSGASLFDVSTGKELVQVVFSETDCANPAEFSVTGDSRLRLVCEGDHYHPGAVIELNPETLAITASVSVELYPERMGVLEP